MAVFERFTVQARQVVVFAQEEARTLKHDYIGTEHILLGLLRERDAQRLGVARSTVYAHWREWGGYKLCTGDKAPIRFDQAGLPVAPSRQDLAIAADQPRRRKPPRKGLLKDNAKRGRSTEPAA